MSLFASIATEEHVHDGTRWVAVRSRGAEWSWLTPEEAAELGRLWVEKYGAASGGRASANPTGRRLRLVEAA
jgi:hypothetical protein